MERLRLITIGFVAVVLLGSLPGFLLIKQAVRDPAFVAMDELPLPAWAAGNPADSAAGNRWCVERCRVRQRVWQSSRDLSATVTAYRKALSREGWRPWHVEGCPPRHVKGNYTCWRRDAYTLDLWVRVPDCRKKGGGGSPQPKTAGDRCPASEVTVVVRNAGADARLR